MAAEQLEPFDLEQVYDEQIAPLMMRIIEIRNAHRIPMCAAFAYAHSEANPEALCTTTMPFSGRTPQRLAEAMCAVAPRHGRVVGHYRITAESADGSKKVEDVIVVD